MSVIDDRGTDNGSPVGPGPGPNVRPGANASAGLASPSGAAAGSVPVAADGVQLIGSMRGTGYREPPSLVRRIDGQTFQLTPLLYAILDAVDGHRDLDAIAERASQATGRAVGPEHVQQLIDTQLRPLGLLTKPDGTQPELKRSNPLLGMRLRREVTDPATTRRLTAGFAPLFHLAVVIPVLAIFAFVAWWLLTKKGLASAAYHAFSDPGILLLVVAVTIISASFHEFGHAAAARYGGAAPGRMGVGLYLFWPAFFTDVTDSYRLGRAGRLRTDLGGLYFNALVAVAITGVWLATHYDALLIVVLTQMLQMVRQLLPTVRFDGYHVLADLTGVPDLFQRIGPTLAGLLPWRWNRPESRVLKPWARAVVSIWVLVVIPLLLFSLAMMVLTLPRIIGTAFATLQARWGALMSEIGGGHTLAAVTQVLMILLTVIPIFATLYVLARLLRQLVRSAWARTRGKPARRVAEAAVASLAIAGIAFAWWPGPGTYRPIQPYERGTISDIVDTSVAPATHLTAGREGTVSAVWPAHAARATAAHPALAMILIPKNAGQNGTRHAAWVFPFDRPLPPGPGDNQALAVNTTDGSSVYDVAFALVWDTGGSALNTNSADAYADCRNCTTVAVGFQVVFVVGSAHLVVPQNLSTAANYNCVSCLTAAIANQLVVTLKGPLDATAMHQLSQLWSQIMAFSKTIPGLTFDQISSRLDAYEQQILAIVKTDVAGPASAGSSTATAPPSATPTTSATPAAPASGAATAPAVSTPGPSGPAASTPAPTTAPSPGASTAPTATPQPTAVPSTPVTPAATPSP